MSRFSGFKIVKGGTLLADEWIYDEEKEKGEMTRGRDVTELFLYFLDEKCVLDDGVVFRDILLLIDKVNKYEVLSPIFTRGPWLKDMVDEGLIGERDSDFNVDTMVLGWTPGVYDDYYNEGKSEFISGPNLYGTSVEDSETWALDFTPIYNLADCEIKLDTGFSIYDEQRKSNNSVLLETYKNFTIYNILYGLFWELSFHGGPKDRDAKKEGLMETVRKIESGEEKTIPWEEVKERLREKLND